MIDLAADEAYYILEEPFGRKHLLAAEYYGDYNFNIGATINCRVDKINCSGKIFLEPEHPHHKRGESYDFKINNISIKSNKFNENVCVVTVVDALGRDAVCNVDMNIGNSFNIGESINCKVQRIKKGILYLSHNSLEDKQLLKHGEYYSFNIVAIEKLSDNKTYYILNDEKANRYILDSQFYDHYNFKIGMSIECGIVKFSSRGYYFLEPKHPFYELNKEYLFTFISKKEKHITLSEIEYTITVEDIYGKEIKLTTGKNILSTKKVPQKIKCRVDGVKKGKALLSIVEE